MTNYPPQGQPPQGQPPYGQPAYGAPPHGQPVPMGQPMPPQASNGWSVAALVTGIIGFCVPFVGGLLAILFGFLGIKRSGTTNTGKGMSIAGLILGVLSLGMYVIFGGAIWAMIQGTAVNRDLAKQFLTDLQSQNMTAAATHVDTTKIDADELKTLSDAVSKHGAITDITTVSISVNTQNGQSEAAAGGSITFSDGTVKQFSTVQRKVGDKWVIVEAEVR